ncbi:MAG: discoidin domain-containing protein [Saprospiraceae bacterium]
MLYKNFLFTCLVLITSSQVLSAQTDANIPIRGICIYIDYPDAPSTVSPQRLDSLMNDLSYQEPFVNRSFRKYWLQETRRNFDVQHDIFYFTAPEPASYYASVPWYEGIELWRDALEAVITNTPSYDWTSLSTWTAADPFNPEHPNHSINAIKSVIILSSDYEPAGLGATHQPDWTLSNGSVISKIQGSALQSPWENTLNLFVICHESGHALFGIPDTYDYDGSSSGTAKYSIMSAQGPDLEPVGAPFLYQNHWGYTIEPSLGTHTITLKADGDSVVIFKNIHDPNEFISIEARKNSTTGNSLFPVPLGLLIWHTDKKVHTGNSLEDRTQFAHYQNSIVQKDGLFELESGGSVNAGDIYVEGDLLSDNTTPSVHWWSGEASGIQVKEIQLIDSVTIQFKVVIPDVHTDHFEYIPKENWSIIAETQPLAGFEGTKAFDGDLTTYYHVPYGSNQPRPHELLIDLGTEYEINEFYYTANDNFSPPWEGRIKDFELSFSADSINWESPIGESEFFFTEYTQYALFPKTIARYIRFSAFNTYGDDDRTSIAEIDLRGKLVEISNVFEPEQTIANSIKISPNPTSESIVIGGLSNDIVLRVSNANGLLVSEIENPGESFTINLNHYPPGTYIVSALEKGGKLITSKKFVKN